MQKALTVLGEHKRLANISAMTMTMKANEHIITVKYEGGSEISVIVVITLLIDMIGCCIIP